MQQATTVLLADALFSGADGGIAGNKNHSDGFRQSFIT